MYTFNYCTAFKYFTNYILCTVKYAFFLPYIILTYIFLISNVVLPPVKKKKKLLYFLDQATRKNGYLTVLNHHHIINGWITHQHIRQDIMYRFLQSLDFSLHSLLNTNSMYKRKQKYTWSPGIEYIAIQKFWFHMGAAALTRLMETTAIILHLENHSSFSIYR